MHPEPKGHAWNLSDSGRELVLWTPYGVIVIPLESELENHIRTSFQEMFDQFLEKQKDG